MDENKALWKKCVEFHGHECGGLTIGYAGTDYDTYLTNLSNQKISYAKFDSDYVTKYKAEQTPFETMMQDVEKLFGLKMSGSEDDKLVLTDYEIGLLKEAYAKTLADEKADEDNQEEYVLYGSYEPLSVTITHLLNNKSGINFSSYAHTGLQIPVSLATLVVMAVGFVALGLIILGLRSIREDVKALPDWIPDQESIFCRRGSD